MAKPVTLITGTRKGIGEYLASYYVCKGHYVIGCSRSTPEWSLSNYEHHTIDVTNEADVKSLFHTIRKNHKILHNLINNAGIASMNHSLLTPASTVTKVLNTNVTGTFIFCREAAKLMLKNRYGRIVNFTTVAVPLKLEGEAIYVASKAAVKSMTEVLAREYAEYNITVNSIGPVPVETDLIRSVPKDKIKNLLDRQAIRRFGKFEDISNVIDFYFSENSDFITGQTLYLGGI